LPILQNLIVLKTKIINFNEHVATLPPLIPPPQVEYFSVKNSSLLDSNPITIILTDSIVCLS